MTEHPLLHFFWTLGLLALVAAVAVAVRRPAVRRRLLFAELLLLAALAVHAAVLQFTDAVALQQHGQPLENFLVACGLITAAVALLFNPWQRESRREGTPAIVQDFVVVALGTVAAMLAFQNSSLVLGVTGSAIVAGLALQDTLGNAFAGLAIQVEKPFRVGHWIRTSDQEGRVVEVTWRATKLRTKSGNLVVLPNNMVAGAAISNYSAPAEPTRIEVHVGASYLTPPNQTREALLAAVARVRSVLTTPSPDVLFSEFGASTLNFRLRFWVRDYEWEEEIRSEVLTAIYYELGRRGIEIPYPIQIEYSREEVPPDTAERRAEYERRIASVPVFQALPVEAQHALALSSTERLYADGEVIVREGDPAGSLFIVLSGRVVITVGPTAAQVAVTEAGGYFGEMSLLTGQPRTATVTARGDCQVLEITAAEFGAHVLGRPEVVDRLAAGAVERQRELDASRSAATAALAVEPRSLARRIRKFLGLEG